eukprot:1245419-Prymnesium_polylepis.1
MSSKLRGVQPFDCFRAHSANRRDAQNISRDTTSRRARTSAHFALLTSTSRLLVTFTMGIQAESDHRELLGGRYRCADRERMRCWILLLGVLGSGYG